MGAERTCTDPGSGSSLGLIPLQTHNAQNDAVCMERVGK